LKKAISILFVISCLLSALPLINRDLSVKASPEPTTWTVDDDGPANFTKIQDAINNASPGDTILVHVGTYSEHLVINKTITLVGEDNNSTIIDSHGTDDVIFIRANNVTVKGFTVRNSRVYKSGVMIDHGAGNVITNNKIINNYEGINLLYSSNNVVSGNIISDNTDGINFRYSSNNVVSGNIISDNTDGIYLDYSGNNVISSNVISHNEFAGIELYNFETSNNIICGNTILRNHLGINLALSSNNNTIYHNNFDNEDQARSESTNFWNYSGEGNYWSDYSGQDLDKDGIGDTPYDLDTVNKDNFPLMGMFSNFSVTLEKEMYSVTVISNSTISTFSFMVGPETGNKMIHFSVTGEDGTLGFCRVKIPNMLMRYPYIVLVDSDEIIPTLLSVSNEAYAYLYFTYFHRNYTITIISSKTLALYFELLDGYLKLQKDLDNLNESYYALLENYNILLGNYITLLSNFTQLQISFAELNNTYQTLFSLNRTYYELLDNYLKLQVDLHGLNKTYYALSGNYSQLQTVLKDLNNSYLEHLLDYSALLGNYNVLLYNFTQLQVSFNDLNDTYQKHLLDYSEQMQNIRNLTYILVALTAILIITTVYMSKRAHANATTKIKAMEEK
jgi:parallel beta-helix repeat protein